MGNIAGRLISLIFISVVILWPSISLAVDLYLPEINAKSGQSIDVPIMIDRVKNLAGVKLVLRYDSGMLKFKKSSKTKKSGSMMHIVNDKKPGRLIIVMAAAKGIKGENFSILNLVFEIKKGLAGKQITLIKIDEVQLMTDQLKEVKCDTKVNPIIILPDLRSQTS